MKKFALQNSSFSSNPEKSQVVRTQNVENTTRIEQSSPFSPELLSKLFSAMQPKKGTDSPQKTDERAPASSPFDNRIYAVMKQHDALSKKIDERLAKRPDSFRFDKS